MLKTLNMKKIKILFTILNVILSLYWNAVTAGATSSEYREPTIFCFYY